MLNLSKIGAYLVLFAVLFAACNSKPTPIGYNPKYDPYLSAFTSGEISKKSPILLRFAKDVVASTKEPIPADFFAISPHTDGTLQWVDTRTLEFIPNQELVSGTIYTASARLDKLMKDIPQELAEFKFQFRAKPQFLNISPSAATASQDESGKYLELAGTIQTNDTETPESIEKAFQAIAQNKNLELSWTHEDAYTHHFKITNLRREEADYQVSYRWAGKAIKATYTGETDVNVPNAKKFVLNKTYRYNSPEQHLVLEFSDALDASQNLEGLVTLGGEKLKTNLEGNKLKVYPNNKLKGKYKLQIDANIKAFNGLTLDAAQTEDMDFSDAKPLTRWIGKGNIIPQSKTMPIHFQTINLKSVDVRVIKIKEDNIPQFFQVNRIEENRELKRVGVEVLRKKFDFSANKELNLADWTSHSLDLATLITPEPGAIYEIAIGFRKSYSLYACPAPDKDADGNVLEVEDKDMLALGESWDKPSYDYDYYDYYDYEYEYEDLQDPCKQVYYNNEKTIRRNVLGSDLGILVKRADNDNVFFINNLHTTDPIANVDLELYDFHQEVIARAKTDANGMVKIPAANLSNQKPYFLVAKLGNQRGYLRLDDGTALSLSRFDVQGAEYQRGLKGYIYGERGVWRPGDEMFINFILEDVDKTLPANHPVSFELKDMKGTLVAKRTNTNGVNGFYNFTCKTEPSAPTGNYTATVKVGGATFTKNIKIETIKPNRLKINMDFANQTALSATSSPIKLKANWLHGAVGKGLKTQVEVGLRPIQNSLFEKFKEFSFVDAGRPFDPENVVVLEGKALDANGEIAIPVKIQTENQAPGALNATFRTQVFEEGGDFSIDQFTIPYHPYETYVGVAAPKVEVQQRREMLLTDAKNKIQIATVDKNGNPVAKSGLKLSLYKLDWRWWFDGSKNEVSAYQGKVNATELQTATLATTATGTTTWDLEIKYPEWGRYLVRVCDGKGHCGTKVVYVDWPGWESRNNDKDPEGATALNFNCDKPKYKVGETVTLNIPTGFAGRALVSLESNSKIVSAQWINVQKGTTVHTFTATKEMSPNIYANVTLLQPHAQTKNDLPIRMYGVIPIMVEDANTRLEPTIDIAAELQPLKDFSLTVGERKGGAMTYTVAIVDEGLLDITRFKTPSAWETFYQRMALGVKTWDMYNDVLGAYGGQVKSLLAIGGDAAESTGANKRQDRFKPVVLYAGAFTLAAGEKKSHTFKMPNYVGSVRVMVVAGNQATAAYGAAEKAVPVKQDLMVLATLPRVLSPDEKILLPVQVFTSKPEIQSVEVNIQTNEFFEVVGGGNKTISMGGATDKIEFFEVKTRSRVGTGTIKVTAKSGKHESFYESELTVRNPNPLLTNVSAGTLENNQTWAQSHTPVGIQGTNSLSLEISVIPAINLQNRLNYLIRYPYGCVEQTASAAFPQLYVGQLVDLTEKQKTDIDKNIKAALTRLQRYQTPNGAFGYWAGAAYGDMWATNYVGHFLLEAQKMGYAVSSTTLANWVSFQINQANSWTEPAKTAPAYTQYDEDFTQAYRLYLLALAGKSGEVMGAMNKLRTNRGEKMTGIGRWQLAAAYALAGQKDVAKALVASAALDIPVTKIHERAYSFGSAYRDQALLLHTLSVMDEREKANSLLKTICTRLSSNDWLSTQETAQSLIAVAKYASRETGLKLSLEYRVDANNWVKVNSNRPIWQQSLDGEKAAKIEVRNTNGVPVYPRLIAQGIPAAGQETELSKGLQLTVKYVDQTGKELNPKSISQSTNFTAIATVKNLTGNDLNELALSQIFPSGWEVLNMRLMDGVNPGDAPEFQDQRDDRVYTFFDMKKGASKTFKMLLNATYAGRYYLPAASVESMYDISNTARLKGEWVEVVKK